MNRPSFFSAATAALLLAIAGSVTFAMLAPLVAPGALLRVLVSLLGFAYLAWLLRARRRKTGLMTVAAGWCVISAAAWLFVPALPAYLLAHAAVLWLVRSLVYHEGIVPSLLDLGVTAFGVSAAGWAIARSGSVFLGIWSFFLVQALFVAIPACLPRREIPRFADEGDRFEQARRRAEAAFKQLITRHGQ